MKRYLFIAIVFSVTFLNAKTWQVGPTRTYTAPSKVAALVADGDTVTIDSATYTKDVCKWTANNLTLIALGGRPVLDAQGTSSGGKAIWVITGKNVVVQNIEFARCSCVDWNGAGIRMEGKNLTVSHCYFHDNEDGILGGGDSSSNMIIEYSEFFHNGHGDGYSHNLYISNIKSLTFRYNYSHHARIGHELKSRAHTNYILYNRFSDEDTGSASRNIDLPNGGRAYIIGNIIEQGPLSQNSNIMEYGAEGMINPDSNIYIINNTFVNDLGKGSFVQITTGTQDCKMYNNAFAGKGTILTGSAANLDTSNNFIGSISQAGFKGASTYDYNLNPSSPLIDAAKNPGTTGSFNLFPSEVYVHPCSYISRSTDIALLDIGAMEGGVINSIAENVQKNRETLIYPNPCSDILHIVLQNFTCTSSIQICDLNGRTIHRKTVDNSVDNVDINLSGFPSGIYVLKMMDSTGMESRIFVKE